jgi:hypothetical protein
MMRLKQMIDDLLKKGNIQPHQHIAMQLQLAMEKMEDKPLPPVKKISKKEQERIDIARITNARKMKIIKKHFLSKPKEL